MLKTIINIIFLGAILNVGNAQIANSCNEIREYVFPEKFDEESKIELQSNISKLTVCGYDSIEIRLLQNNSFMGTLVNEAALKMLRSNKIKSLTLNMVLEEFEILRSDIDYQSIKVGLLKYHTQNLKLSENQRIQIMSDVYPNYKTRFELINQNKHKSILYFTNEKRKNSKSFENVVLKDENIAQLINQNFDFYILQTNGLKKNSNSEEKE
ncbi:MAG: hypothetical protein IPJ13_24685 [Saprospiraceae bacterium]|nr:hypothetical protein [Saprospiraceae bacterium]